MHLDVPELWAFGVGTAILLAAFGLWIMASVLAGAARKGAH
jgi:hypothetical protein